MDAGPRHEVGRRVDPRPQEGSEAGEEQPHAQAEDEGSSLDRAISWGIDAEICSQLAAGRGK